MPDYQVFFVIICILASLSLFLNISVCSLHLLRKKLLKHPGPLLVFYLISRSILLTHWFFIFPEKTGLADSKACKIIASYSIICGYMGWFLILFLCCEILIIFRRKLYKSAGLRMKIYVISSIVLPIIIFCCYLATDSIGMTKYSTCFIAKGSIGAKIDTALLFFIYFCILIIYLQIRKQIDCYATRTYRHFSMLIILILVFGAMNRSFQLVYIIRERTEKQITEAEMIFGCLAGMLTDNVVAAGRLAHPKVKKEIRAIFWRKETQKQSLLIGFQSKEDDVIKSIISPPKEITVDDISDTFEKLGHRILVQILVVLTLRFKNLPEQKAPAIKSTNEHERIEIKFKQSFFSNLALEYNMPFIQYYFCPKFTIIEFESSTFSTIRESQNISNQDLLDSFLCYENIKRLATTHNPGGKSESFFFSSINEKIVIKTITSCERESFLTFLPEYSKRIIECPESKLVRILGMFQVYPNTQDFIIMENVLGNPEDSVIFDLKGSTFDRKIKGIDKKNPPKGLVLKDINFLKFNKKIVLKNSKKIIQIIIEDCKVLKNAGLMDYSLLVGFLTQKFQNRYTEQGKYSIAVIDFFQKFGIKKSAEGCWKRFFSKKDENISSISPKKYFKRFKEFLSIAIVEESIIDYDLVRL